MSFPSSISTDTEYDISFRFLYLTSICISFLQISIAVAQPIIQLEDTTTNVGTLYEGQTTIRNLAVVNSGNELLNIKRVWTSCGCTAAKLSSTDILPNGRETLS